MTASLPYKLTAAAVLLVLLSSAQEAGAQPDYEVLHAFEGLPGGATAPLLVAPDGVMYGLTTTGGPAGAGTLFEVRLGGIFATLTTLHEFNGIDGRAPAAALIRGTDGALYGTTLTGGAERLGTIFKFTVGGGLTLLHTFSGPDGANPVASLVQASDGTFYGTTSAGGVHKRGTVFDMAPTGALTTLHSFSGGDGAAPASSVVPGADGHLYGLTYGPILGPTVFKLTRDGTLTGLHEFPQGTTGVIGLTLASDGNFYGASRGSSGPLEFFKISPSGAFTSVHTVLAPQIEGDTLGSARLTEVGGAFYGTLPFGGPNGRGTAFRLTFDGAFTVLHAFNEFEGQAYSGLVPGAAGQLYGVTSNGGASQHGQVFSLTAAGEFVFLATFAGFPGEGPWSPPIRGADGALYGTTVGGGIFNRGIVYRLSDDGVLTILHIFSFVGSTGEYPFGGLVLASDGFMYGAASAGGCRGRGAIFRVSPAGGVALVHCFREDEGSRPFAALIESSDGNLYGTTVRGGANDLGTAFRISPSGEFATIHSFDFVSSFPYAPLAESSDGSFYGTTAGPVDGFLGGSIFRLSRGGERTTLRVFSRMFPGLEPAHRVFSGLTQMSDGSFVGTTTRPSGTGQVFQITPTGTLTVLADLPEGAQAVSAPIADADGHLYGTTLGLARGSIYRISATGQLTFLKFLGALEGSGPAGPLIREPDGSFLGAAFAGGPKGKGVIFRFRRPSPE